MTGWSCSVSDPPPDATDRRPRIRAGARLSHDERRETDLLLAPEVVVRLNGSAAAILRLCDGTRTQRDIVKCLLDRFPDADESRIAASVSDFLERFGREGWLQ